MFARGKKVAVTAAAMVVASSAMSWSNGEVSWTAAAFEGKHLFVSSPDHARADAPLVGLRRFGEHVAAVTAPVRRRDDSALGTRDTVRAADAPAAAEPPRGRRAAQPSRTVSTVRESAPQEQAAVTLSTRQWGRTASEVPDGSSPATAPAPTPTTTPATAHPSAPATPTATPSPTVSPSVTSAAPSPDAPSAKKPRKPKRKSHGRSKSTPPSPTKTPPGQSKTAPSTTDETDHRHGTRDKSPKRTRRGRVADRFDVITEILQAGVKEVPDEAAGASL